MREWLSGGAPPCQGGGRGFDPRLALLLFVAEALILQGFRSFYVVAYLHPPAPSRFIVSAIMLFLINSVSPLLWVDCKYNCLLLYNTFINKKAITVVMVVVSNLYYT